MAYSYDPIFAVDPNSPSNVARNASILIFDPNDATKTPVTLTDVTGSPITNPITVNQHGFGPAIKHATLDRLAWEGAGMSGVFTSYEGMKEEAVAAREAAQAAATTAAAEAAAGVASVVADAESAATSAASSATAAAQSAALVNAPADTAIAAAINGDGTATKEALSATILAGGADLASFAAWGSSSVAGAGASGTTNLVGRVASLLGIASYNGGNWGEVIEHHAARSGAVPALVTIPDFTIPASGAVTVTVENFPAARLSYLKSYTGTLHGIPGTLAYSSGVVRFTRTTAGTAVRIPSRTPFIPAADTYRRRFTLLWVGKNNLVENGQAGVSRVVDYTKRMDEYAGGLGSRNLVLGHFVDSNVSSTAELAIATHAANAQYAIDYGDRYIDVQAFLTSRYAWYLTGISPTVADLNAQAAGQKPPSLSYDNLHMNEAGYDAVAKLIALRVKTLGWFPNITIPALPAEPTFPAIIENTTAPTISGGQATGSTLTATTGTWSVAPDSYTYQWNRDGVAISGATANTYVTAVADETKAITVTVTPVKTGYVGTATPSSNSIRVYPSGTVLTITSDAFTGANATSISTRTTDAGLGGDQMTLTSTVANAWGINNGFLVPGSNPAVSVLHTTHTAATVAASVKVNTKQTAGSIYLIAARDSASSAQSQVRAEITPTTVGVQVAIAGAISTITSGHAYNAGDKITIKTNRTSAWLYVNDVEVWTGALGTTIVGGIAGFALQGNTVVGYKLDDFELKNFL